jgi:hypothetical protein
MTDTKAKPENKPKGTDSQKPVAFVPDNANQELELLVSQKSEAELEALFLQMQKVVLERKDSKKSLAIKDIERIAADAGLSVTIKGHKSSKEKVPKVYQNPANSDEKYEGKVGARKPEWLKALIKAGTKMSQLELKPVQPATESEQPVEQPATTA